MDDDSEAESDLSDSEDDVTTNGGGDGSDNSPIPFAWRQLAAAIHFVLKRERADQKHRYRIMARAYVRRQSHIAQRAANATNASASGVEAPPQSDAAGAVLPPASLLYLRSVLDMNRVRRTVTVAPDVQPTVEAGPAALDERSVSGAGGAGGTGAGAADDASDGVDTTAAMDDSRSIRTSLTVDTDRRSTLSFQSTNSSKSPQFSLATQYMSGGATDSTRTADLYGSMSLEDFFPVFAQFEMTGDKYWLHQCIVCDDDPCVCLVCVSHLT